MFLVAEFVSLQVIQLLLPKFLNTLNSKDIGENIPQKQPIPFQFLVLLHSLPANLAPTQ